MTEPANFNFYLNRQGVRGQQGEQGEQGFSPIITVASNTLSEYILRIQTQNNIFLTPNLREHKEDLGGTYIRYDRSTGIMYAGDADYASETDFGVVRLASSSDLESEATDCVVTPANVSDMISATGISGDISELQEQVSTNTGNISTLQGQMTGLLADYVPKSRTINGYALSSNIVLTPSDIGALASTTTINDLTSQTQQDALNSGANTTNIAQIGTNTADISDIKSLIPSEATSSNKLTDKSYVDTSDSSLQSQINDLKARGRFLALWNCATGLAQTNPPESPYTYQSGDYYIVGTVSSATPAVNYKPDGSSYTVGVASTAVETSPVDVDDVYYYDGTNWRLQVGTQKTVSFANIAGDPYDNSNLSTALSAKADSLSLASVATSGDYDDLQNKPTIPTVNDGTLTIQKNSTTIDTFTANSATNKTIDITVPTDTSDLTNSAGYITGITSSDVTAALGYVPYNSSNPNGYTSNIGTVTSVNNVSPINGDVTLSIPTVNDGTLTIKQDGTTVGTFSANSSSNVEISLTSGSSSGGTSIYDDGILKEDIAIDKKTLSITDSQIGKVSHSNTDSVVRYIGGTSLQNGTYEFVASASVSQYTLDLSSDGTMGGDSKAAACSTFESGHPAYYAFDNSSETTWGPSSGSPNEWVTLYDPDGIQIKTISWLNGSYSEIFPITLIQGSDDNVNFTTIYTYDLGQDPVTDLAVNANAAYKYIRFYFPQAGNYGKFTLTSMVVDSISWSLNGNEINLADYGIEYNGSVLNGETITLIVEDAGVLAVNTENIEDDINDLNEAVFPIEAQFNGTLEGACIDTVGVLSNFGTSSYGISDTITIPSNSSWEFVTEFTTGSSVLDRQNPIFVTSNIGDNIALCIEISPAGSDNMVAWLSTNGSTWGPFRNAGSMSISPNTAYRIKISYSNNYYYYHVWENNGWVLKASSNSSPVEYDKIQIMLGASPNFGFLGTIDANKTYFKVNNEVVWNGTVTSMNKNDTTFYTKSASNLMLNNKADTDLSNLTNMGKIAVAHNAMPSTILQTLTIAASGTDYVMPFDGYLYVSATSYVAPSYLSIDVKVNTTYYTLHGANFSAAGAYGPITLPVSKGMTVRVRYDGVTINSFILFAANGSESEVQ